MLTCGKIYRKAKSMTLRDAIEGKEYIIKEIKIEPQTIYRRTYNSTSIADKTNLLRDTALEAMKAVQIEIR